jgi:hypothetical protein
MQNYFQFDNNFYQPNKGVAMGSPISGLVAETFLQWGLIYTLYMYFI